MRESTAILVFLTLIPAVAPCEDLTAISTTRLREAIEWGRTAPQSELELYELWTDPTWRINFDTPYLRVARFSRSDGDAVEGVLPTLARPEVHVYVHARSSARRGSLPRIDYVTITRPVSGGPSETIGPTVFQELVRHVPPKPGTHERPRLARSVKAVFPLDAFVSGNTIRVRLVPGGPLTVPLSDEVLSGIQ